MTSMTMQKRWYLGFIGLVAIYKIPTILAYFQGTGTAWDLANLLWFIWFLYFIPERKKPEGE